ncbi:MAG: acyl-CoA dehydrogenase family protein, partial [Vulcanimicrobiaceae bacterium]
MSPYRAPLRDLAFVIRELAGLDAVAQLPGNTEATPDLVEAVLDEAAAFASGVLEPLDAAGDREGARWHDGGVSMPAGFTAAYRQFADAGWIGLPFPPEYGGQGLPMLVGAAVLEMWSAANLGFANGPDLNAGAIEALLLCGSPEQKQLYVPRLISGQWTGTMVLTEPQAGSDLAAVRTLAVPDGDHYRISGQKIFITYGEHDMAENIVHLVLARTPTAPPGVKGISLFIVPKFVVNADGTLGKRNDVYCASIEHKLGIRASPTCVLNYGESGGAIGYLVGEENRGLEYMFVMMNRARFAVG